MKKLTPDDVLSIVEESKNETQTALARKYGVSQSHISQILSGKIWSHLTGAKPPKALSPEEKFWKNVKKGEPDECWEWQAYIDPNGYPHYRYKGKLTTASRVAKELHDGKPIPKNMNALHTCGNKACVNPNHIILRPFTQRTYNQAIANKPT